MWIALDTSTGILLSSSSHSSIPWERCWEGECDQLCFWSTCKAISVCDVYTGLGWLDRIIVPHWTTVPLLNNTAAVRELFDMHSLPACRNNWFRISQVLSLCNTSHFIIGYIRVNEEWQLPWHHHRWRSPYCTYKKRGEKFSYLLPLN